MMPDLFVVTVAVLFGLLMGSFANVLILRDNRLSTVWTGRSECPHCGRQLGVLDLVPVLSWLVLRGRCRSCRAPISWQYPLVELAMGIMAYLSVSIGYLALGSAWLAGTWFISSFFLLIVTGTDVRTQMLRVEYTLIVGLVAFVGNLLSGFLSWQSMLTGLLVGGGVIAVIAYGWKLATGNLGMGEGDIWLAGALGVLVGWPNVVALFVVAVGAGALVGVPMLLKKGQGKTLPFGPFLILGALISLTSWGDQVLRWYLL